MAKKERLGELEKKLLDKKLIPLIIGAPLLVILGIILMLLTVPSPLVVAVLTIGALLIVTPFLAFSYLEFAEIRAAEDAYPTFLRDLTQSVNSGMTLPQAIATVSQTNYGVLSKYVQRLNSWIGWNVPFPQAWSNFSNLLKKSEMIQRINGIVLESFEAGGDIGAILSALSDDVDTLKNMEADKKSVMAQHLAVMYVIFFVFLAIIVTLHKILLPILYLQRFGVFSGVAFRPAEVLGIEYFKNLFFVMTIVQAASLGVIAGQITEEKLIAGFKHAVLMILVGIVVFFVFIFPSKLTFDLEVTPQSLGIGQTYTVTGKIFFDAQPAGGANIEIISPPGEQTSLFANSLGEFTTNLIAPTQPGNYQVTVVMTYGAESRTITKNIIVT